MYTLSENAAESVFSEFGELDGWVNALYLLSTSLFATAAKIGPDFTSLHG